MSVLVAVLVGLMVVGAVASLVAPGRSLPQRTAAFANAGALAVLGVLGVVGGALTPEASGLARTLLLGLFLVAVLGGGPVTATVLWLVDRGSTRPDSLLHAGEVLRGGAWVGLFERCAVFATLASGWPEGLAVVLALKGLGRYSELRGATPEAAAASGGVAERFIIGTFASVLWATACAGLYLVLTGRIG